MSLPSEIRLQIYDELFCSTDIAGPAHWTRAHRGTNKGYMNPERLSYCASQKQTSKTMPQVLQLPKILLANYTLYKEARDLYLSRTQFFFSDVLEMLDILSATSSEILANVRYIRIALSVAGIKSPFTSEKSLHLHIPHVLAAFPILRLNRLVIDVAAFEWNGKYTWRSNSLNGKRSPTRIRTTVCRFRGCHRGSRETVIHQREHSRLLASPCFEELHVRFLGSRETPWAPNPSLHTVQEDWWSRFIKENHGVRSTDADWASGKLAEKGFDVADWVGEGSRRALSFKCDPATTEGKTPLPVLEYMCRLALGLDPPKEKYRSGDDVGKLWVSPCPFCPSALPRHESYVDGSAETFARQVSTNPSPGALGMLLTL